MVLVKLRNLDGREFAINPYEIESIITVPASFGHCGEHTEIAMKSGARHKAHASFSSVVLEIRLHVSDEWKDDE